MAIIINIIMHRFLLLRTFPNSSDYVRILSDDFRTGTSEDFPKILKNHEDCFEPFSEGFHKVSILNRKNNSSNIILIMKQFPKFSEISEVFRALPKILEKFRHVIT